MIMETKMIRIPFEVELAKKISNGEVKGRIVTRDGRSVRIICWDRKGVNPIVALIEQQNGEEVSYYPKNGSWETDEYIMLEVSEEKPKCEFKPFDRVLARNASFHQWGARFFDRMFEGDYACTDSLVYKQCIPYNEQTAHLLGTTDNFEDNK